MFEKQHLARVSDLGLVQCRECGDTPTRVRFCHGEPFGLKPSGKRFDEEEFLLQLEIELTEPDHPDNFLPVSDVGGFCEQHFEGPPRLARSTKPSKETVHERTQRLKAKALTEYGGECVDCGQTDAAQLTVCLKDELLASGEPVWVELGVQSWAHKWVRLEELSYPPVCLVRCIACRASHSEQRDNDAKSNLKYAKAPKTTEQKAKSRALREEALAAYGGRCACGQTKTSLLWLVRKPGAEILRYGSGRKLTASQRNARLKKDGWPKTHYVTCQPCWKSSRSGESPDYPESGN